ncbi:MAG: uracil-DNA glycosylase [Oscillospiraceae bacterium]|nr:uracil-DNA glycosylase [Oscillospiraceae bacterium]
MASWTQLEKACKNCTKCPLYETRTNVVFGTGRTDAEIMLVGEGPGESEDLQGEPFVGKAGQLLDDMLTLIGLDRKTNVYIANIVKCRPPKNRDPLFSEQEACMDWLRNQYALVRPKVVICLGRIAASALIHPDFKITREHGKWFEKDGVQFTAIYHPSALLRDESKRPETFVDLKNILQMVKTKCTNTYLNI